MGIAIREFTWEFKRHAQDLGITKQNTKVHLVLALNQDTLTHLDAYVTMHSSDEMVHLETIQDRLHWVLYVELLACLK